MRAAVRAALAELGAPMQSADATAALYQVTLHEDPEQQRRQVILKDGKLVKEGPAAGLWQFERGGGCKGILQHWSVRDRARALCLQHGVHATPTALWEALPHNDVLAAASARLLLWTDAAALPDYRDPCAEEKLWQIYLRVWRPGAWHNGSQKKRADLRAKWAKTWPDVVYTVTHE